MPSKWALKFELKPGTWVHVPTTETITLGIKIKKSLASRWSPPRNYYHLRSGGHVAALRVHLDNPIRLRLDIKDFFGTINRSRVTRVLKEFFGYKLAREWANASTVPHPTIPGKFTLPFGFVQSPVIASLCLHKSTLGACLLNLKANGIAVSVYMDDILCSADDAIKLENALEALVMASNRSGFLLNEIKQQGPANEISAFNIRLAEHQMFIDDMRLQEFSFSIENSQSDSQREGIFGYVNSVNTEQANKLRAL